MLITSGHRVCVCLPSWIWQPGVQCVSFEMELRVLIDDNE